MQMCSVCLKSVPTLMMGRVKRKALVKPHLSSNTQYCTFWSTLKIRVWSYSRCLKCFKDFFSEDCSYIQLNVSFCVIYIVIFDSLCTGASHTLSVQLPGTNWKLTCTVLDGTNWKLTCTVLDSTSILARSCIFRFVQLVCGFREKAGYT